MKTLFLFTVILTSLSAWGQEGPFELNWKIDDGDSIRYAQEMRLVSYEMIELEDEFDEGFKDMQEAFDNLDFFTTLYDRGDQIEVVSYSVSKPEAEDAEEGSFTQILSDKVVLRGNMYKTGGIASFWTKTQQKNLLALLFELPQEPVSVGDSWPIDISFLQMDENFVCDSSFSKNEVYLAEVIEEDNDRIAVINYDIEQFITGSMEVGFIDSEDPSEMKMTFKGQAKFSIDRGRIVFSSGILKVESEGFMNSTSGTRLSLHLMD